MIGAKNSVYKRTYAYVIIKPLVRPQHKPIALLPGSIIWQIPQLYATQGAGYDLIITKAYGMLYYLEELSMTWSGRRMTYSTSQR